MRDGPSGRILGVSSEKQAYKLARNLLKELPIECIAEEATRQVISPSIREKVQAKALLEISKQTENFSTHWAEFSAKGLAKVTDLEAYVKRKLVAAERRATWSSIAPVFPQSTGDNPFILRIKRSPLAPRFRRQSIATPLALFPFPTCKSLKAAHSSPAS